MVNPFFEVGTMGTQSIRLGRIYQNEMGRNWKLEVNYLVTPIIPCSVYSVIGFRDICKLVPLGGFYDNVNKIEKNSNLRHPIWYDIDVSGDKGGTTKK